MYLVSQKIVCSNLVHDPFTLSSRDHDVTRSAAHTNFSSILNELSILLTISCNSAPPNTSIVYTKVRPSYIHDPPAYQSTSKSATSPEMSSSSHQDQRNAYTASLAPPPTNDSTTLIALRGFVSGQLAFRRRVTDFPTFDHIFLAAYEAWRNDPDEYHLHLHFCRGPGAQCSHEDLLERISWESGAYFIGGTISVFAHFAKKLQERPEQLVRSVRAGQSQRDSRPANGPTRTVRRQNPDATTAYSLCQPTERQYFSAPFVFIPCPGVAPRLQLFPARIAERWPGFSFQEDTTPTPEKQASSPAVPRLRSTAAAPTVAPPVPAPNHMSTSLPLQVSDSDSSEDRMSSPEYGAAEEDGQEVKSQLEERSGDSVPRATESLFVPERGASEESESLFVSE